MSQALICDAIRSPIGRFGGSLATMCVGVGQGISLLLERV